MWGIAPGLLAAMLATGAAGDREGDTVSPIDVTISAACRSETVSLSYRNSWLDGADNRGLRSVSINGKPVPAAMLFINGAIKNARIDKVSLLQCYSEQRKFLIAIKVDAADVKRLGVPMMQVFAVDERSAAIG